MLYVIHNDNLEEFKICNGVILIILERDGTNVPIQIHNVHTGKLLRSVSYDTAMNVQIES